MATEKSNTFAALIKILDVKKSLLFTAAAFAIILSSCKKDYTCNCTVGLITTPTTIENSTKEDAEEECNTADETTQIAGGSCTLE